MNELQYTPTRFNILPPVVKNLLIINGLFYLARITLQNTWGIDLDNILGLHYIHSEYFAPYQFITHLFMHGNFGHLFFNMFALWMFGNVLENILGPKKFLIYYFVTGLGAAFLHSIVVSYQAYQLQTAVNFFLDYPTPDSFYKLLEYYFPHVLNDIKINEFILRWREYPYDISAINEASELIKNGTNTILNIPTVGASGAVFGLLLAFGMFFPNSYIYLYFLFPIKAKWFVIFYGLAELLLGFSNRPGDNVAHFAHLGGMIFGFLLIKYWLGKQNKNNYYT